MNQRSDLFFNWDFSLTSQPPKGFSNEIWEDICETPCTDILMRWISQQLVNQDVGKVCDTLSVRKRPSLKSSNDWRIYSDILSTWLTERISVKTTYMSDLILPLSTLKIKTLNAKTLSEKVAGMLLNYRSDQSGKEVAHNVLHVYTIAIVQW